MSRFSFKGMSLAAWLLLTALFATSLLLPSAAAGLFGSPDETAVAVSLTQIAKTGSAASIEPLAEQVPWLHPRSYLAVKNEIVPVGFLGWPWWLAQIYRLLPLGAVVVFASLFATSGAIPWYLLLRRRFGERAAWWGTILAWTFPPVLLYVNRSLFSHLPQYSAVLWALWILISVVPVQVRARTRGLFQLLGGFLFGMALSFRLVEAFWLVPLVASIYAISREKAPWQKQLLIFLGVLLGVLPLFWVQAQTYGSWFQVGYWVQANTDPTVSTIPQLAPVAARAWFYAFAPYGLHPRNVLWNVRSFFGSFLWPWAVLTIILIGGATISLRKQLLVQIRSKENKKIFLPITAIVFSAACLLIIYGSGLYADHVRVGAVTVGNSFLRYTIPFGFLFAWGMAWVFARTSSSHLWLRRSVSGLALIVVTVGVYSAFFRDEEGVFATRQELIRYADIRAVTKNAFKPGDIILSERSDKIFFPELRAVTPLPSMEQLGALSPIASSTGLGFFGRPLSLSERDAWRRIGYDVRELQAFGNERLYRLTPFLR